MAITISNQDVYVGDELRASGAMVFHDLATRTLTFKEAHPTQPGVWVNRLQITDATQLGATAKFATWEGTVDGSTTRVTLVARNPGGCNCGGPK